MVACSYSLAMSYRLWFVPKLDKEHVLVQSLQEVIVNVLIPYGTKTRYICIGIRSREFAIAGHNMTVVEIDVVYAKPFSTFDILIALGETTNVLVYANSAPGRYFMAL
ncbi:putative laccase, partial [Tanacetum coccineum]